MEREALKRGRRFDSSYPPSYDDVEDEEDEDDQEEIQSLLANYNFEDYKSSQITTNFVALACSPCCNSR